MRGGGEGEDGKGRRREGSRVERRESKERGEEGKAGGKREGKERKERGEEGKAGERKESRV